jgi:HK97 family phage prohead protease
MEHLLAKAQTTEVDVGSGTFTARVSGWEADRSGDEIDTHAFDQSLEDWRSSGKMLPLLYEHSDVAIGSLDPNSAVTDERGLVIDGEVDRDTRQGRQVWKQIRRGSIGFMTTKSEDLKGGGKRLLVIDLLEISATSVPMHPGTGVIDWKSATVEELHTESLQLARKAFVSPNRRTLPGREAADAVLDRSRAEYLEAKRAAHAAEEAEAGKVRPHEQLQASIRCRAASEGQAGPG